MTALRTFPISARAAAIDIGRARRWYEEKLGIVPDHEDPGGVWYRFGGETRVNTAAVYRVHGAGRFRLDVAGELTGLHLQRDRERIDAGAMEQRQASGGAMLYAGAGVRALYGPFTVGLGVKRAALKSLNEQSDQQGSEGLERLRAAFTVSYSTGF
jgi:hypothetical protein